MDNQDYNQSPLRRKLGLLFEVLKQPLVKWSLLGLALIFILAGVAVQLKPHKHAAIGAVGAANSGDSDLPDLSGDGYAYVNGPTVITKVADANANDDTGLASEGSVYTSDDGVSDYTADSSDDSSSDGGGSDAYNSVGDPDTAKDDGTDSYLGFDDNEAGYISSDFYSANSGSNGGGGGGSSSSGGSSATTSTSSAAKDTFTVGSYNILDAEAHPGDSKNVGNCSGAGDGDGCVGLRSDRQAKIITGKAGNAPFDIVGTQETSKSQYRALKSRLSGYGVFPNDPSRLSNSVDGKVAVWWNRSVFSLVDSGRAPGQSNTSKNISNPWVELQTKSGRRLYVMSIHYANGNFGGSAGEIRKSSQQTMNWVRSKASRTTPVIVMGDFNDNLKQNLSYCVYTSGGAMQNTMDMARGQNPNQACPTNKNNGIDQIYASPVPGVSAAGWTHLPKSGIYKVSSDHRPVYVRLGLKY